MTEPGGAPGHPPALVEVLERAQRVGFIGAGPLDEHLRHSEAYLRWIEPSAAVVDLGSGGGLPGLVIAAARPEATVRLVEASRTRADHLERAVRSLGWGSRVIVDARPAELVGRDPACRHRSDVVTARGFGPPAVVAEVAAPLLRVGGRLLVSEPPEGGDRWAGLAGSDLPFDPPTIDRAGAVGIAVLELVARCPDRFPRATGVPARRPLF